MFSSDDAAARTAMLGWIFKPKSRGSQAMSPAPEGGEERDLEFLRSRTDFDAEQMAAVHRRGADERAPLGDEDPAEVDDPGATRLSLRYNDTAHAPRIPATPAAAASVASPGELVLSVWVHRHSSVVSVREAVLIGRYDEEQDLLPEVDLSADDAVSRRHAQVFRRGGRFWIRDLDSTNGTRLNGEWLAPESDTPLSNGDVVELGEASALRVLDISFGEELTDEDEQLSDLLKEAMGISDAVEESAWPLDPSSGTGRHDGVDLLEVALARGAEAGLVPQDASDCLPPTPASQWRLREADEIELPSFVEPYR
jgi:pSer/pThr/pTyr-binding forkhead associated (FHA) protein